MITASDTILAAAGFFGLGASGLVVKSSSSEVDAEPVSQSDGPASPDQLSVGEPYFEAVAAALRRTGYLDS
ncbi:MULTISPECIES: hypothetical protein [Methylobacterium]|uniref:Uncharacterized protein n=1 Tax=Methylobacterium thuringiense TaxID=1003091 RepID=A0ABQ4TPI6_9HYPH|nr:MULTISPECIES: hypothetical protein [Methylobacterium]TXN21214.1 hypothetical protein FV217_15190 [Methylobacterium sp. WL9]GJE56567.1 hypothetical protein EKPJFOCH_3074 [Methylobacterium thuringiense]